MDWYPAFEHGWWSRLDAIGCQVWPNAPDLSAQLQQRYLALTPEDLLVAAKDHGIDYVVMPADWPWASAIEAAHANPEYAAFTIDALRQAVGPREGMHDAR